MDRQYVVDRLGAKVAKTRDWCERASKDFRNAIKHGAGVPQRDGALFIRELGRAYDRAIRAAQKALLDETDFLLHDRVPEDLETEIDPKG